MPFRTANRRNPKHLEDVVGTRKRHSKPPPGSFPIHDQMTGTSRRRSPKPASDRYIARSIPSPEKKSGNDKMWTESESSPEEGRIAPLQKIKKNSHRNVRGDNKGRTKHHSSGAHAPEAASSTDPVGSPGFASDCQELDLLIDTISLANIESETGNETQETKGKGRWKQHPCKQRTGEEESQQKTKKVLVPDEAVDSKALLHCLFRSHDFEEASEALLNALSNPAMSPSAALLSSAVGLSLLSEEEDTNLNAAKMVQESLCRHIQVCLAHEDTKEKSAVNTSLSLPVDVDDVAFVNTSEKALREVALMHISEGEPEKALDIYRVLLQNLRKERDSTHRGMDDECESAIAGAKSILTILSLLTNHKRDAWQYATSALQAHKRAARPVRTTLSTMELGLVFFGTGKLTQALQCWREALQRACMTLGYEHIQVALLLSNLGCLHYYMGNFPASLRALEESLGLHRQALRSNSQCASIEMPLFHMATTMGNLAVVLVTCKNYDSASSLIEESLAIQESVLTKCDNVMRISEKYLEQFSELRDEAEPDTDNAGAQAEGRDNSSNQSMYTSDSRRQPALSIFGDSDGIPRRHDGSKHHPSHSQIGTATHAEDLFYDCILLGSLVKPATARQRVQSTLVQSLESTARRNCLNHDDSTIQSAVTSRKKHSIPVDIDGEAVIDAEFHLEEINAQALDHLTVRRRVPCVSSSVASHITLLIPPILFSATSSKMLWTCLRVPFEATRKSTVTYTIL